MGPGGFMLKQFVEVLDNWADRVMICSRQLFWTAELFPACAVFLTMRYFWLHQEVHTLNSGWYSLHTLGKDRADNHVLPAVETIDFLDEFTSFSFRENHTPNLSAHSPHIHCSLNLQICIEADDGVHKCIDIRSLRCC